MLNMACLPPKMCVLTHTHTESLIKLQVTCQPALKISIFESQEVKIMTLFFGAHHICLLTLDGLCN